MHNRQWWTVLLVTSILLQLVVFSLSLPAVPVVIDFEDLQPSKSGAGPATVFVTNQYADRGIIFNGPAALDYSQSLVIESPDFAHSGTNAIQVCYAVEFCRDFIEMSFTAAQTRVKVWIGVEAPGVDAVALRVFDAGGSEVGRAMVALSDIAEGIHTPLEVTTANAVITRAAVQVLPEGSFLFGLFVDDVEFGEEEVPTRELTVRCLHEPLWPQPDAPVTITAESFNEALVRRLADAIEIWVGEPDAPDQTSTNVTSATFSIVAEAPSFVYGCRVRDDNNAVFSGWRRVAVGTPATGRAVPVIFNGSRANSVDILLVPDRDSYMGGATDANFLRDAASVIRNAYYRENVFRVQQRRLNFWLAQDTGVADGFFTAPERACRNTAPANFETEYLFAQSAGILHTDSFRDCASGRLFSSVSTFLRVILHETGHASFGLADEYCCDGGYWQPDSNPNVYGVPPGEPLPPGQDRVAIGRALCEADAPNVGRVAAACHEITNAWFTSDPVANDLMVDNRAPQALDLRRINAVFDSCAAGTLEGGC